MADGYAVATTGATVVGTGDGLGVRTDGVMDGMAVDGMLDGMAVDGVPDGASEATWVGRLLGLGDGISLRKSEG